MKRIILPMAFLCMPIFANDYKTKVSNFNLQYTLPEGLASSDYFEYQETLYNQTTQYSVQLQAGSLYLETPDELIEFESLPASLENVDEVNVSNLNITSSDSVIALDFSRWATQSSEGSIEVKSLDIDCSYEDLDSEFLAEVLHSCFNKKGSIIIDKYTSDGETIVEDANFKISANDMDFQIKAAGFKIKGEGKTYYEDGILKIKIEKAKYGFINVKKKLFKELEAMESDKVRVDNPWIEIEL